MKNKIDWKKQYIIALADLSYAQGVLAGLGKPDAYIVEQVGAMMELLGLNEEEEATK